ncbi:MAG: hypothetical protein A2046_14915 [Bacteroidetes bacterium GWA2_30_7]|nr:MAG: hypothetical protein A2046_14915 [Bacteroidetes bacterium GWA2_30_7]
MKQILNYLLLFSLLGGIISCTEKKEATTNVIEEVFCDAEHLTSDSSFFITDKRLTIAKFNHGERVSNEKAKSGKNSLKLTGDKLFGMAYTIQEVKSGDVFQIEVWRYCTSKSGKVVVSAENVDDFYLDSGQPLERNADGWERLEIKVVVPIALNGKPLKVNVWNPDKSKVVYFDDLKISLIENSLQK